MTLERSGPADCFLERFIDAYFEAGPLCPQSGKAERRQCSQLSTWSLAAPLVSAAGQAGAHSGILPFRCDLGQIPGHRSWGGAQRSQGDSGLS